MALTPGFLGTDCKADAAGYPRGMEMREIKPNNQSAGLPGARTGP